MNDKDYPVKIEENKKYKIVVVNSGDFIVFPSDEENHTFDIDRMDLIFDKYNKFLLYKDKGEDLLLTQNQIEKYNENLNTTSGQQATQ